MSASRARGPHLVPGERSRRAFGRRRRGAANGGVAAPPEGTRRARIVFVGVDPGARGGIAQFGANLVRSVGGRADTFIMSYRRLYPRFTRPGRQGPDPSRLGPGLESLSIIVPWKPSTWRAAAETLERFPPDLVVLQWWSPLFGPCVRFLARRARWAGARVVIVCHNDRAHENFPFGHSLTRAALGEADVLLTLSSPVAERVRKLLPGATVHTLHHPPNMPGAESAAAASAWRRRLGPPDGPVILFFGNVRKYKGLGDLIAAMPLVQQRVNARLVVAGTFFEPAERFRTQAMRLGLELDRDVRLLSGYVPREQVPDLFARADVVALPYRAASQSGVIAQAALAGKPVVVTAVGGLPEALDGRGVVVQPANPAALAAGIVRALEDPPPPPPLPSRGWDDWRDALLAEVVSSPEGRRPRARVHGAASNGASSSARDVPGIPESTAEPAPVSNRTPADRHRELTAALGQAVFEVARAHGVVELPRVVEPQNPPVAPSANGSETIEAPPSASPEEPPPAPAPEPTPEPEPETSASPEPEIQGWRRWPIVVAVLAFAASVSAGIFIHATERVALFGDTSSHLLHGRRVFDSATPGFGQLGNYWPPLQHFLELPFVWFDPLYHSMWAGSLPAMAFYVIGVMGAYRLGVELTRDRKVGALAAFAFGANPSLLYLQATPMLESAIAMSLVWVAASLVRFRRTGAFRDVVVGGLWSSVAVWSTWGAMILPLYGAVVVAAACRRHGYGWRKTETFSLAYALAAGYALVLWIGWNFYIQRDPLYMLNYHQAVGQIVHDEKFVHGQPGDPGFALQNYGTAVIDLLGPAAAALMVIALVGALLRGKIFHPGGVALIGGGLVIAYMTVRGTAVGSPLWADLKDLPKAEGHNLNMRYALWMAPFVPVAVAALAGRARLRQAGVLVVVLAGMIWFLPSVHGVSTIEVRDQSEASVRFQTHVGSVMRRALEADAASMLVMSQINGGDKLIWRSEVDAKRFLTEANGERFQKALDNPARYARWALLAPGSALATRYEISDLMARGYSVVWSTPDLAFALLRRGAV